MSGREWRERVRGALLPPCWSWACRCFAILFTHQRRRIRYLLRNRLTPLSVLSEEPPPMQRGLPWGLVGVVVVITLAVLPFASRGEATVAGAQGRKVPVQ